MSEGPVRQDKRKVPRHKLSEKAYLRVGEMSVPVQFLDITSRGSAMVMNPLESMGEQVMLHVPFHGKTYAFQCNVKNRIAFKDQRGRTLWRVGVEFSRLPENAQHVFSAWSGKINKDEAPTVVKPPDDSGHTQETLSIESSNPTVEIGVGTGEKRKYRRKKMQLPLLLQGENGPIKGKSSDFSEVGIGFFSMGALVVNSEVNLVCRVEGNYQFQLSVQIKFCGEPLAESPQIRKIGAKILTASPEFQRFLDENRITQKRTLHEKPAPIAPTRGILDRAKYKFIKHLGTGGFAKVYLVEDLVLHRKVAMKVLLPKIAIDRSMTSKFIKEAQIAAKFYHPNIALVFEAGEILPEQVNSLLDFPPGVLDEHESSIVYFTMQFIEGRTLADIIKKEKKLPPLRVVSILKNVGAALQFAHREGVIHRDIKPENIMVTYDNRILVTDFGIASILSGNMPKDQSTGEISLDGSEDKTRGFMGTPLYVSPEQILEEELDGRCDLYSLGITGYELLTGGPPFHGNTWMETLAKQLHEPPPALTDRDPSVPGNFNDFILNLIQKKRELRPLNMDVFLEQLEDLESFLLAERVEVNKMEEVSPETIDFVEKVFRQFAKTFKTIGTYPPTHEMVNQAIDKLFNMFEECFKTFERLDFEISSMQVFFNGETVYSEDQKENGFCFNLFRDGVRTLVFFRGLPIDELKNLMTQLYLYINNRKTYEIDAVTILFQLSLKYIDFEYADSFYEDPESQARIYNLQKHLTKEEAWSVPQMLKSAFNCSKLLAYHENLNRAYWQCKTPDFEEKVRRPDVTAVRLEAIRISLLLSENEQKTEVFDHHYHLMEEVIHSCVSENDLTSALFVIKSLEKWALNAPQTDLRDCAGRFLSLKERLSCLDFIQSLVEKYFYQSRSLAEEIKEICKALLPELAVPVIFELFVKENESWKKAFLAQCCVIAAGPQSELINQLGLKLDDEEAAVFLNGYRNLHDQSPKTSLMKWLSHNGPETRMVLVQLANQLKRSESSAILKRVAQDRSGQFAECRKLAWQVLERNHLKALGSVVKTFFDFNHFKTLGDVEQKIVFDLAGGDLASDGGEDFLIQMVQEKGLLGAGSLDLDTRKKAAERLKALGSQSGFDVLKKESKRLLGNREFIQFLKTLCEDLS